MLRLIKVVPYLLFLVALSFAGVINVPGDQASIQDGIDAAVNGAFDRDIAAADQIAGELRVRTEDRVLNTAGWTAGANFVPVVMGRAVPTCVELMAGLVLSEHELDTPSANGSHE